MDHLYSDYFLNLAQVSIGFVGFSTIAVVLREMIGTPLDRFQTLIVRYVIECGLAATIYAVGGVLLAVVGLTPPMLWRVGSAALGVFGLVYPITYVHRRRRIKSGQIPLYAVTIFVLTMAITAVLWLNALTPIFHFSVGPYAIGVTWLLAQSGIVLLNTFSEFLRNQQ
ncbi:MAG TPA: hypothetical protein VF488_11635 [Gemmatimonadaceae bacterium]